MNNLIQRISPGPSSAVSDNEDCEGVEKEETQKQKAVDVKVKKQTTPW